jgi:hypothetical protein
MDAMKMISVDDDTLATVRDVVDDVAPETPVFVGSGVTADTVGRTLDVADGVVVGTATKRDGETTNDVVEERVRALLAAARD